MLGAQMRRRDAGPVRVVGSSECPVDHDHQQHAAIR